MKSFSIILLLTFALHATDNETHNYKFTHVSGTEMIDGHFPGVNADTLVDILKVHKALSSLLHGEKKYICNGIHVNLSDLNTIFDNFNTQAIDHNAPDYVAAQDCLKIMIEDFIRFSDKFLAKEAHFIQKIVIKIIHTWAHKSGRKNSLLLQWGTVNEKELFRKISAHELKQFCLDLKNFLYDLMFSCPKAREQFKEKYLKTAEKRNAFDHSFQQHSH